MIRGIAHFAFALLCHNLVTAEAGVLKRSLAEMGKEAELEPLAKKTIIDVIDTAGSQPAGTQQTRQAIRASCSSPLGLHVPSPLGLHVASPLGLRVPSPLGLHVPRL